jgi:hypothetical protein
MDVPEGAEIELGDGTVLRIDQGEGFNVSTEIQGVPVDLRLNRDGLDVDTDEDAVGEAIDEADEDPAP